MLPTSIFVIDTETTGLWGYPEDLILEIGIVKLHLDTSNIVVVYDEIIGYKEEDLSDEQKNAWIFDNSSLSLKSVLKGKRVQDVAKDVQNLLHNKLVAIYNVAYDYDKFLKYEPFNLDCTILPCIMKQSTKPCKVPHPSSNLKYKWPRLGEAQEILLDGHNLPDFLDPHRAISDAYVSAMVLSKLIADHEYPVNDFV